MRAIQRLLSERIATEFNKALLGEARALRPDLLFVFKGPLVKAETISAIRAMGTIAIQFYPDVSFRTHGPWLPDALQQYDWVFTTKTFGLHDMEKQLGITRASFLPHAFDPETHRPPPYTERDIARYECDVSFIGNSSPKKRELLQYVTDTLPNIHFKIWGPSSWAGMSAYQGQPVFGTEYAKAIALSRINLGLLSEQQGGASSGDQITARTFEIPAAAGFVLHERTEEALIYFREELEFSTFADKIELVDKLSYFLKHRKQREAISQAGHRRCMKSGYSVDDRARTIIEKYSEIKIQ